jgi:hypothetical protein
MPNKNLLRYIMEQKIQLKQHNKRSTKTDRKFVRILMSLMWQWMFTTIKSKNRNRKLSGSC